MRQTAGKERQRRKNHEEKTQKCIIVAVMHDNGIQHGLGWRLYINR